MNRYRLMVGHVLTELRKLPSESVHCVVCSPPYWGLRDYGIEAQVWGGDPDCAHEWGAEIRLHKGGPHGDGVMLQGGRAVVEAQAAVKEIRAGAFCRCGAWRGDLGLEPTPELYVEHMVEVFADVHRVLRRDGTLWLNLGDCYASGVGKAGKCPGGGEQDARWAGTGGSRDPNESKVNGRGERRRELRDGAHAGKHIAMAALGPMTQPNRLPIPGLKPKDLVGMPWRVAFALQADGWWLRSDIVWGKPNPMPESVTDRPTRAHEYLFLLTKSASYFYDADAIRESSIEDAAGNSERKFRGEYGAPDDEGRGHRGFSIPWAGSSRNRRSVWTIATQPYPGAHFATFPEALVGPCIKAGTSERGACPTCGAPWERQLALDPRPKPVAYEGKNAEVDPEDAAPKILANVRAARLAGGEHDNPFPPRRTLGWSPSCACYGTPPLPRLPPEPESVEAIIAWRMAVTERARLLKKWSALPAAPCIVLDPFAGSGTALMVALRLGREGWGIELSPKYAQLARARIEGDAPLLNRNEEAASASG